jgi:acyl-CoA thioesterase I
MPNVIGPMRYIFECFFLGLIAVWVLAGTESHAQTQPRLRVVVYGDSLISGYQLQREDGYAQKLKRKLQEVGFDNVEVINLGLDNANSTEGVDRLDTVLMQRPDIAIVGFGSVDVQRGVSPSVIHNSLASLVMKLKKENVYVILVGVKAPESMGYSYSTQLDQSYYNIARHYQIPLYPDVLAGIIGNQKLTLADGLHPNSKGVDIIVEGTYRMVDAALRWKIESINYQRQVEESEKENPVIPSPPRNR